MHRTTSELQLDIQCDFPIHFILKCIGKSHCRKVTCVFEVTNILKCPGSIYLGSTPCAITFLMIYSDENYKSHRIPKKLQNTLFLQEPILKDVSERFRLAGRCPQLSQTTSGYFGTSILHRYLDFY